MKYRSLFLFLLLLCIVQSIPASVSPLKLPQPTLPQQHRKATMTAVKEQLQKHHTGGGIFWLLLPVVLLCIACPPLLFLLAQAIAYPVDGNPQLFHFILLSLGVLAAAVWALAVVYLFIAPPVSLLLYVPVAASGVICWIISLFLSKKWKNGL
jgi:hypothetical protein